MDAFVLPSFTDLLSTVETLNSEGGKPALCSCSLSKQMASAIQGNAAYLQHIESSQMKIVNTFERINGLISDLIGNARQPRTDPEILGVDPISPYQFSLVPNTAIKKLVYKKKPFAFSFRIAELSGEPHALPEDSEFWLELWLESSPSKLLERTFRGRKLFLGSTKVVARETVEFKRVWITTVSSKFDNGCFTLVVRSNHPNIKPYALHNFVVKARKMTTNELMKKAKLAD